MVNTPTFITTTHRFWSAANKILTPSFIANIYKICLRQAQRYGADPKYCADTSRNPLDLLLIIMESLQEAGRPDAAYAGLNLLADPLGYTIKPKEIYSDKGSICLELMDVNTALGNFCAHYQDKAHDGLDQEERTELTLLLDKTAWQIEELIDAVQKAER